MNFRDLVRNKAYRRSIRRHIKVIAAHMPEKAALWKKRIKNW